jgi:hypothetical protein
MDDTPSLPPGTPTDPPRLTMRRVLIWGAVGGIGVFLIASGILGIVAKG